MLKNYFRQMMGGIILLAFLVGIFAFVRQTRGNPYLSDALGFGMKVFLFLACVVGVVYLIDRRVNQRAGKP